jgi:pentatricopeptide repeat protein
LYGTCLTLWEPYIITAKRKDSQQSELKKEVYLPKCLVIISGYQYLMAFREFLTQLNRLSKIGEMTLPLERYISNFCAEIPAPPPGAFEVQTTILDSVIKIWSPPYNQPIAWVALPFTHLFECLDIDNIMLVWHCLAIERQVLLTSTQLSLLTSCGEILISLLFPMRWSHAYIPVLPHFLVPMLSAPMPFLCGIDKTNLAAALEDLSRECVVVDLDMNLVTLGPGTAPLPPLPPQMEIMLRSHLEDNAGMVFREARSLTKHDDYSDRGMHLPHHVKQMADAMWEGRLCLYDEAFHLFFTPEESRKNILNGNDMSGLDLSERDGEGMRIMTAVEKQNLRKQSQWDAVQEGFLDCYVYMLRNYRKFLVFPSKENEGSYGGAGFRSKDFVSSQRYDMQELLQQLIGTQMFDDFITKRLYGSGEADVTFFDQAVDSFLKTQGILSNVDVSGRFLAASGVTDSRRNTNHFFRTPSSRKGPSSSPSNATKTREPTLQSARVHRKLKTIVPPEPSAEGLPPLPIIQLHEGGPVVAEYPEDVNDDISVSSGSTLGTHSTQGTARVPASPSVKDRKSIQDKAAEILQKSKYRYTYPTFPSELNAKLFGEPRPLPPSVIEEFDRQKKDAARFRRKKSRDTDKRGTLRRKYAESDPETQPSAEVSTFTLFFMTFTAMVGKDLMDMSENPLLIRKDRTILASYCHPTESDMESDMESDAGHSFPTTTVSTDQGDEEYDDEEEKAGVADMKSTRPSLGGLLDDDDEDERPLEAPKYETDESNSKFNKTIMNFRDSVQANKERENKAEVSVEAKEIEPHAPEEPKRRFTQTLSSLQIEEAKATGRAQLALAFEMLTSMKRRGLKADPEAYQSLIDACGRVGDTKRATELLKRMHEDGIVADGVVYSCLVSAFSNDSAWKQGSTQVEEDLPEWANSTAVEMDWNKLQEKSFVDRTKEMLIGASDADESQEVDDDANKSTYQRLKNKLFKTKATVMVPKVSEKAIEFFATKPVEMQIELGENLLEIVYPDISVDTDNETCPRCNFLLSDDDVVKGWTSCDSQDYTTGCPNCMQRFVPHFCVQSSSSRFLGSRGPASPLMCERLSPWVLQKEIRTVMADREGIENLLSPKWRETENKNAVLWWNLVLSCMRYRFPFTFILQGSFEQNLIAPMPEQEE